jgi:tetratricopeptide (TPR) repeat protein
MLAAGLCAVLIFSGCSQPTPEERLLKAQQSLSQNDPFGAEIELRRLIEKSPDDPAAIEARMMLAAIYARDERLDDALAECKQALEKVSLNNERGMTLLRQYNEILKMRKRYQEGLDQIAEFEKKYANEPFVRTSLLFARADLQTHAGQTTAARATLSVIVESTTDTRVLPFVRQMAVQTYLAERDTTGAINRVLQDYEKAANDEERFTMISELASLHYLNDDYANVRKKLVEATEFTNKAIANELDRNKRKQLAFRLYQLYRQLGNVGGARDILEALLAGASIPESAQIVPMLAQEYIREGRTSDAITAFREAGKKLASIPNSPAQAFLSQADMIQNLAESKKLPGMDTSTMTLHFRNDAPLGLADLDQFRNPNAIAAPGATPSANPASPVSAPSDGATTASPTRDDIATTN